VCLSAAVRPHYCMDPDVTWGRGRGCPLVVHYWADFQAAHRLRCYGNDLFRVSRRLVDDAKYIVVTRVSVCVCLSVCVSVRAACLHYCTDPDVTWGSGRGCPLVVHYLADLQSVHGLRCYGNTRNAWQTQR